MKLWQIDKAVKGLCKEVDRIVQRIDFIEMTEDQLIKELLVCILGSGVRHNVSVAYATGVIQSNLLIKKKILNNDIQLAIKEFLQSPVKSCTGNSVYRRYRYPNRGAKFISHSIVNIYNKYRSLKKLVSSDLDVFTLRRELIYLCPGIGPKQASHFLKNIGYTDELAILDRHIIRYMELAGENNEIRLKIATIDKYEEIEKHFISLINKFQYSVSVVDQAMWFVMRALGREAYV
jgi:N-glycosylase/DNA lyase